MGIIGKSPNSEPEAQCPTVSNSEMPAITASKEAVTEFETNQSMGDRVCAKRRLVYKNRNMTLDATHG